MTVDKILEGNVFFFSYQQGRLINLFIINIIVIITIIIPQLSGMVTTTVALIITNESVPEAPPLPDLVRLSYTVGFSS